MLRSRPPDRLAQHDGEDRLAQHDGEDGIAQHDGGESRGAHSATLPELTASSGFHMALTTKQKQFLKGLAHSLAPVVRVGRGGVSESVIQETKNSLLAHELIKVRIDFEE